MLWLYGAAGSGFLMLGIVLVAFLVFGGSSSGGSPGDAVAAAKAAGCTLKDYPGLSQKHVTSLTAKVHYNSFPPSSGPHYFQPAPWGLYDEPLSQVQVVHNLEHGGVAIQYGNDVPASAVDEITHFYRDDPNGLIVDPLPKLGSEIALTAWTVVGAENPKGGVGFGHVEKCTRFDEKAFEAFLKAYRYEGPESCTKTLQVGCFRKQDLEPGE